MQLDMGKMRKTDNTIIRDIKAAKMGIILSFYIILKPLYLRPSGSLQIADVFLLFGAILLFIKEKGFIFNPAVKLFLLLCLYQLIINGTWSLVLGKSIVRPTLYYFFNLIVVLVTITVRSYSNEAITRGIIRGCFISLVLTSVGLLMKLGGIRRLGFFNNPNQLGYYALLMLTYLFYYFDKTTNFQRIAISGMATWSIICSASKAAFIAAGILAFLFILLKNDYEGKKVNRLILKLICLGALLGLLYLVFYSNNSIVYSNRTLLFLRRRMLALSTENDSALGGGRGYDRIFELRGNFLWGMGEGAFTRFNSLWGNGRGQNRLVSS